MGGERGERKKEERERKKMPVECYTNQSVKYNNCSIYPGEVSNAVE